MTIILMAIRFALAAKDFQHFLCLFLRQTHNFFHKSFLQFRLVSLFFHLLVPLLKLSPAERSIALTSGRGFAWRPFGLVPL